MKTVNSLKNGLIHGIGFITIIGFAGIAYATFSPITQVTSGSILTADTFNKIITNQENLNTRLDAINIDSKQIATAWVSFRGSDGYIFDSFNVASVVKNSTGNWTVNFQNEMVNSNFATIVTDNYNSNGNTYAWGKSTTYTTVGSETSSSLGFQSNVFNVVVFGGK